MTTLYLTYYEHTTGGDIDEDDISDYPSRQDEDIEWSLRGCHLARDKHDWNIEQMEVDFPVTVGSEVWVVSVRYNTGGTFGRANGAWKIIGIYQTVEQATQVKLSIDNGTYNGAICWEGYFEKFLWCDAIVLEVQP